MGVAMSSRKRTDQPSVRDGLASNVIEALAKDWAEHGPEVIQQIRRDNPVKYGELIVRLVPMDANTAGAKDFSDTETVQEIGMKLLSQLGLHEDAMTESMIAQAVEANDMFVARLEEIIAQGSN
jgi:hypothetical protein